MKRTKEQFIDEVLFTYEDFIYDISTDRICICGVAEHSLAVESWLAEQFSISDLINDTQKIIQYASECLIVKSSTNSKDDDYVEVLVRDLASMYRNCFRMKKIPYGEKMAEGSGKWIPLAEFMEQEQKG